jgi:hypothetical protein
MILGLSGFGAAVLAFLWPTAGGGFGSKISVGKLVDIEAAIQNGGGFAYYPEGRMWITAYPPTRWRRPGPCTARRSWPAWRRA